MSPSRDGAIRWVRPEQWHITLRFFGDGDAGTIDHWLGTLALPAAHLTLGPTVERLGASAIVVPVKGAEALAVAVGADADFTGHLTLGRLRSRRAPAEVIGHPVSAAFDVEHIVLVDSTLDNDGPTYTTIGRHRLG